MDPNAMADPGNAGLLEEGVTPEAAPAEPAAAPGGDEAVTPEEQQALDAALDVATQMIYEKGKDQVLKMIQQPPFHKGIAQAAALVTQETDKQSDVPETMVLPLGIQIAGLIAEMGEAMKFYQRDEKFDTKVQQETTKELLNAYGTDEQTAKQLAQDQSPEMQAGLQSAGELATEQDA